MGVHRESAAACTCRAIRERLVRLTLSDAVCATLFDGSTVNEVIVPRSYAAVGGVDAVATG